MFRRLSGAPWAWGAALAVLLYAPLASAHDVHWGGEVRMRYEADDRSFQNSGDVEHTVFQRTRVLGEVKNDEGAGIVIQIQDSRIWGDEGSTLSDTENVDLHQAYVHLISTNIRGLEWYLGRQEVKYGGRRVFSGYDWSNVGRSFDAARLRVNFAEHWIDLAFGKVSEAGAAPAADENVAWGVWHIDVEEQGISIEPLLVYKENSASSSYLTSVGDHGRLQQGRLRIYQDFVFQTGEVGGSDAEALLFGVSAAVDVSPDEDNSAGLSAGYSIYTGDDPADDSDSAYDNLYYDEHKYHGYMDLAHGIVDPFGLGLQDIYLKGWFQASNGLKVVGAVHIFTSDIDVSVGSGGDGNDVGKEFDIALKKDLASGMSAQVGGGLFSPGDLTDFLVGDETAGWLYAQGTARF